MKKYRRVCNHHPKHSSDRKPTNNCGSCWVIYLEKHPDKTLSAEQVMDLLMHHIPASFGYAKR